MKEDNVLCKRPIALALGVAGSLFPLAVLAQQADSTAPPTRKTETTLPEVSVNGGAEAPYKADRLANPKFTQPLVDTPQTISVINKEIIQEQGGASLMEALRNTPGITMQLGEGGNTSAGDTFMLRAFSTQTATFVDGIRDLGAITRDVFNVEQVEVAKGPAGADIGRGAASGYINLISKVPLLDDVYAGTATWNTADHKRVTADVNKKIGETAAFRLNAMAQGGGVAGRDEIENNGYGIAPSLALGLGTPTRFYLYSQHIRQDNVPDGGIPTIGMDGFYNSNAAIRRGAKVDRDNYYGGKDDYERVDADMATARIEHDLGGGTTIRNISRYGTTNMDRILTSVNAISAVDPADPSTWTVERRRQRVDQTNDVLANQTNLTTEFDTGPVRHSLSAGLEFIYERQKTLSFGTTAQTINGVDFAAVSQTAANLYDPDANDDLGDPYKTGAYTDGDTLTSAIYAFDTLDLTDRWQLNGGLRYEHYKTSTDGRVLVTSSNAATHPGYSPGQLAPTRLDVSDNLLSWKVGALFKPAANGSIYVAYANSLTPPGGGNFALSETETNQNHPSLDPQETTNIELGTKWELLDARLNVSAAVYRTENDNQISYNQDTGTYSQFGKTRVDGIELAAVGQITNFWQVSAGIAKMETKALDQASRNSSGVVSESDGVRWTPDLTATLWTSYTLGKFTLGGGARHVSDQKRVVTKGATLSTQNMPKIPSYWVADLMAAYQLSRNVNLRLNVYNVFDEDYISTLNNSGARMVLGAPRSAALSAEFLF